MLDSISLARLDQIHPALAEIIKEMAGTIPMRVAAGLRTWEEQAALYAQGRTAPGVIVTDAPAGYSWHQFGLAVDCYPNNPDGSIDWNPAHVDWKNMEALGISKGLDSGATWTRLVDAPHFQLIGSLKSADAPSDDIRAIYNAAWGGDAGIKAVWAASGIEMPG